MSKDQATIDARLATGRYAYAWVHVLFYMLDMNNKSSDDDKTNIIGHCIADSNLLQILYRCSI